MGNDVYQPFDADVEAHGGYRYATADRRSSVHANRRFSDVLIGVVEFDGKRVVDVGCGDGTYTAVLRAETRAAFILGIDPAARAIERATAEYAPRHDGLAFRNCFAADLLAEGQHFDVAVYRGVIHHVGNPAAEIASALKLADKAFFIEPNGYNPVVKLIERLSPYHRSHSERSYSLFQYRRWVGAAGGRMERAFYFGLVPMFCPDWFVPVAAALEPVVESMPGMRTVLCGQVGILASLV